MKRLFAVLLSVLIMCSMLVLPAAARNYVISPEYGNDDEEIVIPEDPVPENPGPEEPTPEEPTPEEPAPEEPGVEIPEEPVPMEPTATAPQTGYEMGIMGLAATAALCGSVAIVSGKKAFQR